jgi:hypothetical protein
MVNRAAISPWRAFSGLTAAMFEMTNEMAGVSAVD